MTGTEMPSNPLAAIGFDAVDFARYASAFKASDLAGTLAAWVGTEPRPAVRRALVVTLVTIEEATR